MKTVIISGAGIAGLSTALDLTLRGFKCTVLDKGAVGSGTTTRCAGMLHSGSRYIVDQPDNALLCNQESEIFKKIVPFATGKNKGIFVITPDSPKKYVEDFEKNALKGKIKIKRLTKEECIKLEPNLSSEILGGFETPDVVINPFLVVAAYKEELTRLGTNILEYTDLLNGKYINGNWKISVQNVNSKVKNDLAADIFVNATGSWASETAAKLQLQLDLVYIQGTMFLLDKKICDRVVSVCAPNTTGDVITPSGKVSLAGSTWHELKNNKLIPVTEKDRDDVVATAGKVFPLIRSKMVSGNFSGIRTHLNASSKTNAKSKFAVDRNLAVVSHLESEKVPAYSVLAGKLTFGRLVAKTLSDKVCSDLGIKTKCRTDTYLLKPPKNFSGTELSNVKE